MPSAGSQPGEAHGWHKQTVSSGRGMHDQRERGGVGRGARVCRRAGCGALPSGCSSLPATEENTHRRVRRAAECQRRGRRGAGDG
eukprot:1169711-Rhodomonas_salina.1